MASGAFMHEDELAAFVEERDGLHRRATGGGAVAGTDIDVH
jgi:hypothetical protein